jgi:hypothetical protein
LWHIAAETLQDVMSGAGETIQMVFDFTMDLAELEAVDEAA